MTGWASFAGRAEPLIRGRATCTILRLPADVVSAPGRCRRVEGETADHPVNLALACACSARWPWPAGQARSMP